EDLAVLDDQAAHLVALAGEVDLRDAVGPPGRFQPGGAEANDGHVAVIPAGAERSDVAADDDVLRGWIDGDGQGLVALREVLDDLQIQDAGAVIARQGDIPAIDRIARKKVSRSDSDDLRALQGQRTQHINLEKI